MELLPISQSLLAGDCSEQLLVSDYCNVSESRDFRHGPVVSQHNNNNNSCCLSLTYGELEMYSIVYLLGYDASQPGEGLL
jgi:hypothetical protein